MGSCYWRQDGLWLQIRPRGPDFKHKSANEGLWVDSYKKPAWIEGQLEAVATYLFEPGTSTMTTDFERGPREEVHKNSSGTSGIVRTLCKAGQLRHVLQNLNEQGISADSNTYIYLLQECIRMKGLADGKQVHAHIIQNGFKPNLFLYNTLINMYAKCGSVVDARLVFDKMPERNMFTWTILMAGYAKHGYGRKALDTYEKMIGEGFMPDRVTFLCALKACVSLGALEKAKEVHADIIKARIMPNVTLENTLIDMYAKCRSMTDARKVFDNMAQRAVVSWNAMITGYAQHGCGREALETYEQMIQEGVMPDRVTFICAVKACSSLGALEKGREVHADFIKAGIQPDIILDCALVAMYAKCGSINDARKVFDNMAHRDLVSWNAMITGYAQHRCGREALETYEQMEQEGVMPNQVTFVCILNACANLAALEKGKEIHANIVKAGIETNTILQNTLIDMYCKCGSIKDARQVFESMGERDVVSWNAMISGYAQNGYVREALATYELMICEGVVLDRVTFICVLNTCAGLAALEKGRQIHVNIIRAGVAVDIILGSALVNMYAKCGCGREALEAYEQMISQGVVPDQVAFICALNACASLAALERGKAIHADIVKAEIEPNIILQNSLVNMYAKCGNIKDARQVFDKMAQRDVVSWNVMITGYAKSGFGREASETYEQMIQEGGMPDKVTFISILNACACLVALEKGKEIHADIIKAGIGPDIILDSALVNMYAKCGSLKEGRQIFDNMAEQDMVSWSAMIAGYAQHGYGRDALQLFDQMQQEGLKVDRITLTCVLSACSHGGLVDEGRHYFYSLSQRHGLIPSMEHFGCMVDLLGRAGHLDEAENFINNMPIKPDVLVWGALLGACKIHGNVDMAERAAKGLLKCNPQHAATYVMLSNIYAAAGRWVDAAKVRKMMKDIGVRKVPGRCCIEVNNRVHTFIVDDKAHPQIKEIHAQLKRLSVQMKEAGYVPDTRFALHNVDEEQKQVSLCYHSEKLAIAYGLLSLPSGMPICIIKNLRVCGDCHTATKFISKIVERAIVVRDANRFHHFQDGVCSCGEYW